MRRTVCILLAIVLSLTLVTPFSVGAADVREEFIRTGKSTYQEGEFIEIEYEFDAADPNRWICIYKGSVSAGNMVYAMTATALRGSNVFIPPAAVGMNGTNPSALTQPGSYVMKVMYTDVAADLADTGTTDSFAEGAKSTMTNTFTVQAGGSKVPSIAVADKEIGKGGTLNVQFDGVVNTLGNNSLYVEVQDANGKTVKSRVLWNGIYYAGKSGEVSISLTDLAPGSYTARLVCTDSEFVLGTDSVAITVTQEPAADVSDEIFPDNLFSSAEICGKYFANSDNPGNTYDVVDGEYVMHVPLHPGNDFMYTWESIPYSKFTVTFEFLLHIVPGSQYSDEMDFLFGMPAAGLPFHQVTLGHHAGSFNLLHYKHTGATFENYEFDTTFIDIYEEETWFEFTAEITPEEVSVYLNGEWYATLEDTANCIGEYGHIGLRGGSTGGWKVKNLKVAPGTLEEQASGNVSPEKPTQTPEETPTEVPEETPSADDGAVGPTPGTDSEPVTEPTPVNDANDGGSSSWIWIVIVIAVVAIGGGIGIFVFVKKKK